MAEDRGSPARALATRSAPRTRGDGAPGPEELRRAREVLEAVVSDRSLLAQLPDEERTRLLVAAGRTIHPDLDQKRRLVRSLRSAQRRRAEAHDRSLLAGTGIRAARESEVFVPPPRMLTTGTPEVERPREVLKPRTCYVCKAEYRTLHAFYDALCPACAELNYEKRFQTADLHGRVALVTGARVKIGYQAALKLLRAGATVVATTRFPHDAARRYASEPDFADWGARLQVHGLDLRHSPSVEIFCSQVSHELGRLDLLVNNACQTVRRPPGFFEHLLDFEERPIDALPPELQAAGRVAPRVRPPSRGRLGPGARRRRRGLRAASSPGAAAEPASACAIRRACPRCASDSTRARAARTCFPTAPSTPISSRWTCGP